MPRRLLQIAVLGLAFANCSKASEESSAKRSPLSPPPPETELPSDLNIPVEVDGEKAEPVTAKQLSELEPDFSDPDRRAWLLTRVLGAPFDRKGAEVDAVGEAGVAISMSRPESADLPQPVLYLTRRGDVVAAVVEPEDPFPDYHGQGGRLRRPGDPLPRVLKVERLRVRTSGQERGEAPEEGTSAAPREALESLQVTVGDKDPRRITEEELARVPDVVIPGDTGDARSSWSLRHLARAVAGKKASVTQVAGSSGEVKLSSAKWTDDTLTPILRVNRRGELVFHWIDGEGEQHGDSLRGVERIDVAR